MYVYQELQLPKDEGELRKIQDYLYQVSRENFIKGEVVNFKGLKEIAFCEVTIVTAIHKLKLNRGSNTPGVDGETMRTNILEQDYQEIINRVKTTVENYTPTDIRRVNIPKDGTTEVRPIGIITTIEKIIQECVRMIIEPILEAQFFDHSYGFRPLRDAHMALERIQFITHRTGYHWAIEGDISKFFDCVNHNVLLGALFHMGIRDSRILQMIKAMLKAGIMNEVVKNELGVPQGSNLSPLLANVYLNRFDHYITREWEEKKLERKPRYDEKGNKDFHIFDVLRRKIPIIKPRYLIRYSDDWLIVTNSLENAKIIRYKIKMFLQNTLKLTLSEKKTRITNMKKKSVRFLGFEIRVRPGKSRSGCNVKNYYTPTYRFII